MTMFPAIDNFLSLEKLTGAFKSSYEWLSEFCHPNSFAHMITGRRREGRRLVFEEQPTLSQADVRTVAHHANMTFHVFLEVWDSLKSTVGHGASEGDPR